ncbi:unnamed protein product [Amoebophrya sp. A25]|nr:unnamed protein product [Amoebophrya sp. A25]|eukprot:GSA25T00016197001.1
MVLTFYCIHLEDDFVASLIIVCRLFLFPGVSLFTSYVLSKCFPRDNILFGVLLLLLQIIPNPIFRI